MSKPMWGIVMDNSKARGLAKLVMLVLADAMNGNSDGVWLAVPTIAARSGISERQIQYSLRELEQIGELERVHGAGQNGTHLYRPGNWYRAGGAHCAPDPESLLSGESESSSKTREYKGLGARGAPLDIVPPDIEASSPKQPHPYAVRGAQHAPASGSAPHPKRANPYAQWDTSE